MKLVDNGSVRGTLERLKNNVLETCGSNGLTTMSFDGKRASEFSIEWLKNYYESHGIDTPVRWSVESVRNIPFNRDIDLTKSVGSKNLKYYTLKAKTLIMMDYSKHDRYLEEYIELGYYDEDIKLPQIREDGNLWMTPTMMEYKTMKKSLERSHGKVLKFGCGIGFYQYMCLLRDEVESITIVEINQDIINNFKNNILPLFKTIKEVNIIHGDAFDYFNDEFMKDYDYVFVDIWLNNNDGSEIYARLMKNGVTHKEVDYWIEDTILLEMKRFVFLYLWSYYRRTLSDVLVVHPSNDVERYCKAVNKVLKKKNIILDNGDKVLDLIHDVEFLRECYREVI